MTSQQHQQVMPEQRPPAADAAAATPPPDSAAAADLPKSSRSAAGRSGRAWTVLLLLTLVFLAVDLATKAIAFAAVADAPVVLDRAQVLEVLQQDPTLISRFIPRHDPVTVAPYVLEFTLVLNAGAVFGAGQGKRWFFIVFTFVSLGFAVWVFARLTRPREYLSHAAIALVIAGGLGNLYDRLRFGVVRDFLHPLPDVMLPFGLTWPSGSPEAWPYVSNVADAFLIIGIAYLLVKLWRTDK